MKITQKQINYFLLILHIIFIPYWIFILSSNPGTFGLIGGIMGLAGSGLMIGSSWWNLWKMKNQEKI